jgi:DNA repair exonuclease SbcCD nuclease subunit
MDGVAITARGIQMGEGRGRMDWSSLPNPPEDRPSILLLHASVNGIDDGREQRLPLTNVSPTEVLNSGYSYTALGHLHIKAELQIEDNIAGAAYAGPPSPMDFDERGPGGILVGDLSEAGARLRFFPTAQFRFKVRTLELPPQYEENYRSLLDGAYRELLSALGRQDIVRLAIHGDLHESRRTELEQLVKRATEAVAHCEHLDLRVRYTSGVDPLNIPEDSLLGRFLRRSAAESQVGNAEPEVIALVRRFGWNLFNGQGLPMEISE